MAIPAKNQTSAKPASPSPGTLELSGVMTIGATSRLIGVCVDTIRIWEKKGLIKPQRIGNKRIYGPKDMERLRRIHLLIHFEKINIAGVRTLLSVTEPGKRNKDQEK